MHRPASTARPRARWRWPARVSPFLELGVGFNPELTARENVVLASSLIGIAPQRAKEKFGEIIEFAELEDFVDLKHKNYSTGMAMRLAFATAIHVDADILLIDEALAVGDAPFKEKSYQEFWRMKDEGADHRLRHPRHGPRLLVGRLDVRGTRPLRATQHDLGVGPSEQRLKGQAVQPGGGVRRTEGRGRVVEDTLLRACHLAFGDGRNNEGRRG